MNEEAVGRKRALSEVSSDSEDSVSNGSFAKPLPLRPSRRAKKVVVVSSDRSCPVPPPPPPPPPLSRLVGVVLFPPLWRLALAVAMLRMRLVSTRCLPLRPRLPLSQGRSDGLFHLILMALLIVSIKTNGLRDLDKRSGFLQWLRVLVPCTVDVVCVQEAHCTSAFECDS